MNVALKIDDRELSVPKGTLIIEAAKGAGIDIPFFCYHPKLSIVAQCRICLVEVEKFPKLQPACVLQAAEGMIVRTRTDEVLKTRKGVLEILLSSHPLDCPICDKGGECPLQNLTYRHGPGMGQFKDTKKHFEKPIGLGPRILLDRERCIVCSRCTRFCEEISGHRQISLIEMKGARSQVGIFPTEPFDSQFSGNTVEICPVGALTSRPFRFKARPWELKQTPSLCTQCGLGCNVVFHARDHRLLRVYSRENPAVDDGWLCDRGRYETLERVDHSQRLTVPLMRGNGGLEPVDWGTAFQAAAGRLQELRHEGTPQGPPHPISGIASCRLTNETLFLFRKFLEVVMKSSLPKRENRLEGREWGLFVDHQIRNAPHLFSISDLDRAEAVLILGTDPSRETPVLDLRIKNFVRRGGKLWVYHTKTIELHGWTKRGGLIERGHALEILENFHRTVDSNFSKVLILLGPHGFENHGAKEIIEVVNRAMQAFDREGKEGSVGFLFPEANTFGAIQMGFAPTAPEPFAGPPALGMILAGSDSFKEVWPVQREGESRFLLVLESYRTAAAEKADLVLPMTLAEEMEGTITNTEGRVQRLRQGGRPPGQAKPGWWILSRLAQEMGYPFGYENFQEVLADIAHEVSGYDGVTEETIGMQGIRILSRLPVSR